MKFVPFTVSVKAAPGAVADAGDKDAMPGVGLDGGGLLPPPPPPPQAVRAHGTVMENKDQKKASRAPLRK